MHVAGGRRGEEDCRRRRNIHNIMFICMNRIEWVDVLWLIVVVSGWELAGGWSQLPKKSLSFSSSLSSVCVANLEILQHSTTHIQNMRITYLTLLSVLLLLSLSDASALRQRQRGKRGKRRRREERGEGECNSINTSSFSILIACVLSLVLSLFV